MHSISTVDKLLVSRILRRTRKTLDNAKHAHTSKKAEKKKKNRVYQRHDSFFTSKRTLKVRTLKERLFEETSLFHLKDHGKNNEPTEKLSWKTCSDFPKPTGGFTFSRVLRSQWSLRLAWSHARLAICILLILRTTQTSLLRAISHCLTAYWLSSQLFSILISMAESLTTQSANPQWFQNWSRTRSDLSTFGFARWS